MSIKQSFNHLFNSSSIYTVHDEIKDKHFELELGWISKENGGKFEVVPRALYEEAEKYAKESIESDDEEM